VIGTTELMRAKPDGYTIGMIPVGPLTTQPHIRELAYNADSFDHVCMAYSNPQVLIVARESPINSVAEFVAHAKRNAGQVRHGSSGPGTIPHLAMVDFARKAGIEIVHVPQKGEADSFRALLGGVVEAFPVHTGFVLANADRVKAIGIMAQSRRAEFPGIGTFREAGYDVVFDVWGGVVAPKGIPAAAKGRLEAACRAAYDSPEYQAQLKTLAMPPLFMAGAEFERFVRAEFTKNGALLREAGLAKR
jgi:tripartite-type tricarboxylate transporter receptor subunit TctC